MVVQLEMKLVVWLTELAIGLINNKTIRSAGGVTGKCCLLPSECCFTHVVTGGCCLAY